MVNSFAHRRKASAFSCAPRFALLYISSRKDKVTDGEASCLNVPARIPIAIGPVTVESDECQSRQ
jgi:hypothetical protein